MFDICLRQYSSLRVYLRSSWSQKMFWPTCTYSVVTIAIQVCLISFSNRKSLVFCMQIQWLWVFSPILAKKSLKSLYFRWQFFFAPHAWLQKYTLWKINIAIFWVFLLKYNIFETEKKEVDQFRPFWVFTVDFSQDSEVAIYFCIFVEEFEIF